jgi:hypothetical protein
VRTSPLRLVLVVGVTVFVAARLTGWLDRESEPRSKREGKGIVSGVVVDDTGKAIDGAQVFLTDDETRLPWTATSQADGKFVLAKLPEGTYQLGAAREGYLPAYFAQSPPGWGVTRVAIGGEATLSGYVIRLPRTASISGTVVDKDGTPLASHEVRARAVGRMSGEAIASATVGVGMTDKDGHYTIDHLDAGEYAIVVRPRGRQDSVLYHPAASKLSDARTIALARGEQRAGIDVRPPAAATSTIEGVVAHAGGPPPTRIDVLIFDADASLPFAEDRSVETDSDGRFVVARVPAGKYVLVAQTAIRPTSAAAAQDPRQTTRLSAAVNVSTDGSRPARVTLALEPGVPVSGKIIEPYRTKPVAEDERPLTVRLTGMNPVSRARLGFGGPEARVTTDGAFTLFFVPPGEFTFLITDRQVESLTVNDNGVASAAIGVTATELRNVSIAVSARTAELAGTVRNGAGAPTAEGAVILFPADARRWRSGSYGLRLIRPDSDGRFLLSHLPSGDHLAVALKDLPFSAWDAPPTLERLRPLATPVRLTDGDVKTVELQVLQTFNKTDR